MDGPPSLGPVTGGRSCHPFARCFLSAQLGAASTYFAASAELAVSPAGRGGGRGACIAWAWWQPEGCDMTPQAERKAR